MFRHIALLGDSAFDNASYTRGEPDVSAHLRHLLGSRGKVTLLARDGATTTDVGPQIERITGEMTHLVVSLGGNDALLEAGLLDTPVRSTAGALDLFDAATDEFETRHRWVMEALADLGRALVVCTIYNGNLGVPEAPRARVALMMWNDVIVRSARSVGATVIEMRTVCTRPEDFANAIEPSGTGGRKIAEAIARACG